MIEQGCTPLVTWMLFGSGILVGVALAFPIVGALARMRGNLRVEHPTFPVEEVGDNHA